MPSIDASGGSHGSVVRMVSERNERCQGRQNRCRRCMADATWKTAWEKEEGGETLKRM